MNTQQKQRFFASYWGQKVMYVGGVGLVEIGKGGWNLKHPDFFLSLTHPSKITDAHAIFIANDILKSQKVCSDEAKIFQIKELLESRHQTNLNQFQWEHIYSFMRGEGYVMPFEGISIDELVESGVVELK